MPGGFFHSLLFKDSDEPQPPAAAAGAPAAAPASPALGTLGAVSSPTSAVDPDIYAQLSKVLADNHTDSYDYFAFRQSVENMKTVIPGEAERFKATYAAVASIVTPEKLASSVAFYMDKLQAKHDEFSASLKSAIAQRVDTKNDLAKANEGQISALNKQLAEITANITKLQEDRSKALNDAVTEQAKIEQVKNRFEQAFSKITGEIQGDLTKIKTYLTKGA